MHWTRLDFSLALLNAGNSKLARMAMMAITTSNSMSVNARLSFIGSNKGRGGLVPTPKEGPPTQSGVLFWTGVTVADILEPAHRSQVINTRSWQLVT